MSSRRSVDKPGRHAAALALCAVLTQGSAASAQSPSPSSPAPGRPATGYSSDGWRRLGVGAMRGATLGPIESSLHPNKGYGTDASAEALDELVANGCTWVSVTPFGRLWDLHSTRIQLDFEAPFERNREAIRRVIAQAHGRGLRVLLVPHLWVEAGGWRGEIDPGSEERWALWFQSYTRFVTTWARVAEETHAELFSIGVEMKSSSASHAREWFAVIDQVRRSYRGMLTYSANWDEEPQVPFWDRLDVVGINAFYPLAERDGADLETLRAGAIARANRLGEWAERAGRPVLFTEYGYTARPDPAVRPWEWPEDLAGVRVDPRAQALAYRALLEAFVGRPWFAGAFVWRYYADPMDASQEAPWGFSPRGRDAEQALREIYALRWGADPDEGPPAGPVW